MKSICACGPCQKLYGKLIRHVSAIENMSSEDKMLQKNLDGEVLDEEEEEKKNDASAEGSRSSPASP